MLAYDDTLSQTSHAILISNLSYTEQVAPNEIDQVMEGMLSLNPTEARLYGTTKNMATLCRERVKGLEQYRTAQSLGTCLVTINRIIAAYEVF